MSECGRERTMVLQESHCECSCLAIFPAFSCQGTRSPPLHVQSWREFMHPQSPTIFISLFLSLYFLSIFSLSLSLSYLFLTLSLFLSLFLALSLLLLLLLQFVFPSTGWKGSASSQPIHPSPEGTGEGGPSLTNLLRSLYPRGSGSLAPSPRTDSDS